MKFFAVHLEDLEGDAFASATDHQIVTWLFLHAYCCKQLNGGVIEGAADIPAKLWLRHGIEHHEILSEPSPLWEWVEGMLRVKPYDREGQALYEKKSKAGRATAAKRWGRGSTATRSASSTAKSSANSSHDAPVPRPVPDPRSTPLTPQGGNGCESDPSLDLGEVEEPESKPSGAAASIEVAVGRVWKLFPGPSRNRSTKKEAADAWRKLKPRPELGEVLRVLGLWAKCDQWTQDGGKFVPAVHRWIRNRGWESEPEERSKPLIDLGGRKPELLEIDLEETKPKLGRRAAYLEEV